ncbi:MAG: beta-lactamase family protein [Bacteroidales bacterium]|nr:beta-lactamase family protein [Bacteroidales bacterium]
MKNTVKQNPESVTHGYVAEGFEEVKREFIKNFEKRREIGASFCVYYQGEKVVDLWGGYKNKKTKELWQENTIAKVFSTTKGMSLLVLAKLHSDGLLDYNEKVATYWPEFAKNEKEDITIEQLITHKGGLVLLDRKVKISELKNFEGLSTLLENAKPIWKPGSKHGYHAGTIGLFMQQLVMRIDKKGRTIGQYFSDEIAKPLGVDFYIGLPANFDTSRLATLKELIPPYSLFNLGKLPKGMWKQTLNPFSLFWKSMLSTDWDVKDPEEELRLEEVSGGGAGEARALAKIYSILAEGGEELRISPETINILIKRAVLPKDGNYDEVMGIKSSGDIVGWSCAGFKKNDETFEFGSELAFGFYGTGGSFAYADPDNKIGYAYVMNKMDWYTMNDPREIALRVAMFNSISKLKSLP